jgi:hypothetical protein
MPNPVFEKGYWLKVISRPDWYFGLVDFLKSSSEALGEDSEEFVKLRREVRDFFKDQLLAGKVKLAENGPDLDVQRESVDTIVIHHTSGKPCYTLPYMNAVQLLNIYAPAYEDPSKRKERNLKGEAVWSGHFRNGQQVFWGYHWLMRMDGSIERILEDEQLGWHSGVWGINKRSIGICLDNDYEHKDPTDEVLQKLADHIKEHYPSIRRENILGHCEIRRETVCPGNNFTEGWKPKLVSLIYE